MNATEKTFRPFETTNVPQLGKCLTINAINATIPDSLLPSRVVLHATYHRLKGYQWYAQHDGGVISFLDVPGDGEPSLRQLVGWLDRHGYRDVTPGLGDDPAYARS